MADRHSRTARVASVGVLGLELAGSLLMWAPIPLGCLWLGGRAYAATGSLFAGGCVALVGFAAAIVMAMKALVHLDLVWIALRRRSGHEQAEGALTQVVVVSATFGILGFLLWFYVLGQAFTIPFMGHLS